MSNEEILYSIVVNSMRDKFIGSEQDIRCGVIRSIENICDDSSNSCIGNYILFDVVTGVGPLHVVVSAYEDSYVISTLNYPEYKWVWKYNLHTHRWDGIKSASNVCSDDYMSMDDILTDVIAPLRNY